MIAVPAISRRALLHAGLGAAALAGTGGLLPRFAAAAWQVGSGHRPPAAERKFSSLAVEAYLNEISAKIGDPTLRTLFVNCFPNTLDTTVVEGTFAGRPDTAVVTGDIPAMWLRDSSAQVWPYLPLCAKDPMLRRLLEGVIRRQTRCLLLDPYANAFMADLAAPPLPWSVHDDTVMKQGVAERKYELDSLCSPIRLAYGYWRATGDTSPFDASWKAAMTLVLNTMRVQQRVDEPGPYRFQRRAENPTDSLVNGIGNPGRPVGMIASCFRPSDDACMLPFLIPANLFAVISLRQLATMAQAILQDTDLAGSAASLAGTVEAAVRQYGIAPTAAGTVWAYEVDGFGGQVLMDDANVPSLLSLPYLDASPDCDLYARTRAFLWSGDNPWFFRGLAGEGIGGPHIGRDSIWPISQMVYALTSRSDVEVARMLALLKAGSAGTGFMHESYDSNESHRYTRAWFAWANSLFGELIVSVVSRSPHLLG